MSDWDRYAAEEYELLVAEEGGNDNQEEISCDEIIEELDDDKEKENEDDDDDEDILSPNLDRILSSQIDVNDNRLSNGELREGGRRSEWPQPRVTVTDFDEYDTSSDYAADSDDCSL